MRAKYLRALFILRALYLKNGDATVLRRAERLVHRLSNASFRETT